MRRCRQPQPVGFRQNALAGELRQTADGIAVGFVLKPGLDWFPIITVERPHERRAEYGLANSGVSPGHDKAGAHGSNRSSSKRSASIISLTSSILVFKVNAMRKRAVPSGTVGGLMARMS